MEGGSPYYGGPDVPTAAFMASLCFLSLRNETKFKDTNDLMNNSKELDSNKSRSKH